MLVVWECEATDGPRLQARMLRFLKINSALPRIDGIGSGKDRALTARWRGTSGRLEHAASLASLSLADSLALARADAPAPLFRRG